MTALSQCLIALGFVPGWTTQKFLYRHLPGTTSEHNRRQQGAFLASIACFSFSSRRQPRSSSTPHHHIATTRQCLPNANGSPQEAASDTARCTADSGVQVPPGEIKAARFVHLSSCDTLPLPPFSSFLKTSIFTSWHQFPYIQAPDLDRSPFLHHPSASSRRYLLLRFPPPAVTLAIRARLARSLPAKLAPHDPSLRRLSQLSGHLTQRNEYQISAREFLNSIAPQNQQFRRSSTTTIKTPEPVKMSTPKPTLLIPGPIEFDDAVLQSMSHFRYASPKLLYVLFAHRRPGPCLIEETPLDMFHMLMSS